MRVLFTLMALAAIVAAACGSALSWDGSLYLFSILDKQIPFAPHWRLHNAFLQLPTLAASQVTDNLVVLRFLFSLTYALVPLFALALSWWMIGREKRALFVWPVFGIAVVSLLGQFCFVSESTIVVQLMWPVLLATLVSPRRSRLMAAGTVAILMLLAHPTGAVLLGIAAAAACLASWRNPAERRAKLAFAAGLALLAVLACARFVFFGTGYETERLSLETLRQTYKTSMVGIPLLALICASIAATLLFLLGQRTWLKQRSVRLYASGIEFSAFVLTGGLLLIWAAQPRLWMGAIDFRSWIAICTFPLMVLAISEGVIHQGADWATPPTWRHRLHAGQVMAAICLLVLGTQSLKWSQMAGRLAADMAQSSAGCIAESSLPWARTTPLSHWSVAPYSVLLQTRSPSNVVVAAERCTATTISKGFQVSHFDLSAQRAGWFHMANIKAAQVERAD